MQASESVPFLSKPKRLDSSLPGYVGFDPLGLSDYVDVKWLQEGEIKNGRVAMLGVVGLIVPEVFTFPFFKKELLPMLTQKHCALMKPPSATAGEAAPVQEGQARRFFYAHFPPIF